MVGACYVVICINLLSTLVGILEFPNLVKLPKFTSNGREKRKIFLYISSDRHTLKNQSKSMKSPLKLQQIKGFYLLNVFGIDHPESVFGWCLNKGKRPRQCFLFTLNNATSCVPVDHYSAYFYLVWFSFFGFNPCQHITKSLLDTYLVQAGVGKVFIGVYFNKTV